MRILITGASSGIGRATAMRLAQDAQARERTAAKFILVGTSAERLEPLADELRRQDCEVACFAGDLADAAVPAQAIKTAEQALGGLDVLISNAGRIQPGGLAEVAVEEFDQAFALHTRATWLLAKAAHPLLAAARGCIVATGSIAATQPTPLLGAYSASKAALLMLIRQMSVEWGPDGIRCNIVSPGSTHTAMNDAHYSNPEQWARTAKQNALGTIAAPEDQAAAISFLASPGAAYLTGEEIIVDGGRQNMLMGAAGKG